MWKHWTSEALFPFELYVSCDQKQRSMKRLRGSQERAIEIEKETRVHATRHTWFSQRAGRSALNFGPIVYREREITVKFMQNTLIIKKSLISAPTSYEQANEKKTAK